MKKLLIGIGNPGKKYHYNRHNAGILFVNYLKNNFQNSEYILEISNEYMNSSGVFVSEKKNYFDVDINNLYIAHDDLDLPLGEFKIQQGVGPKVHNGINSINHALKNSNYWRIRIGIDNRSSDNRTQGEKYVLENFTKSELGILEEIFEKIKKSL